MKRGIIILALISLAVCPTLAQELTGTQIVEKLNETLNPEQSQGMMTMIIQTSSGQERRFVYETFSKNHGEKNLIRYLEPARSRGQATLMLNHADDIWAYFPRTKRVRKLAEHAKRQKMEGSDFSYEDMGSGDVFLTEYEAKRLDDETIEDRDCYQVELKRKEGSDAGYSRLIMWVDKENFVPLVIDYYHLRDPGLRLKRMVQRDIEVIQGIPTARTIIMSNLLDNTETRMEINSVDYNVDLSDDLFTERGLRE